MILSFSDAFKKREAEQSAKSLLFERQLKNFLQPRGYAVFESRMRVIKEIAQATTYLIDSTATSYVTAPTGGQSLSAAQIALLAEAICHLCQEFAKQGGVAQAWSEAASQCLSTILPLYAEQPATQAMVSTYVRSFKEGTRMSAKLVKELNRLASLAIHEDDDNYVAVLIETLLKPIRAAA